MPRPPKHVPPDTLGGRIRAAREQLRLSLAYVAADRYSTSLISQIERNRVEPSYESLQFLAEQLQLPFDELLALSQQHKESEAEARQYQQYEDILRESSRLLANRFVRKALEPLIPLNVQQVPTTLRWRLAALRGQCYFAQRYFLLALNDFLFAVAEKPGHVPQEQRSEAMLLHLHLAATHRELKQYEQALEQYTTALHMMDQTTSLIYVAEAQWGLSLVASESVNKQAKEQQSHEYREKQYRIAIEHATTASTLYRAVGDFLRAALLTCQIGLIEQASGNLDSARQQLREVLDEWLPTMEERPQKPTDIRQAKEKANVVSAVACALAGIELEANDFDHALQYVYQARKAGKQCYKIRLAEAEMMLGRILEYRDIHTYHEIRDQNAEKAFRDAIAVLADTDRLAARMDAHDLLGRHLMKKGQFEAGDAECNKVRDLTHLATTPGGTTTPGDEEA